MVRRSGTIPGFRLSETMTMSTGLLASAVVAFATLGRAADNVTQTPAQAVVCTHHPSF